MRLASLILLSGLAIRCAAPPTAAQLDADNPVVPNAPPPYGMEAFFDGSPQPDPQRVRLGRWLFYDTRLSADRTISCATCHRPEFAFSEPTAVPLGIGKQPGSRKTPSLLNLAARTVPPDGKPDPGPSFFWDGRASSLEAQALVPIANPREMGLPHDQMVSRLSALGGYQPYFRDAFGSPDITTERVAAALADFVRTLRSGNAPYDRWSYGKDARALSKEAQRGVDIFFFKGRCAGCHAGFNFSDGRFHNLGVGWNEATQSFADEGRMAVSHNPVDRGAFKTPGLREVARHAPYMHDGSLATLRDVVEFYNRGGIPNPNGSGRVALPTKLSSDELDALVAFLRSLNGEGVEDRRPHFFPQ